MDNTDVKKPFGASVKVWRSRRGISQEELAGRAGLHRTYVSDVERGARNVSLNSIEKLARALEIPASALLSYRCPLSTDPTIPVFVASDDLIEILIVEDHPADVELTMHALQNAKIANKLHVARDGAEALDFLFATGQYAERRVRSGPQLVLLDLNLPKIPGLEVLRRIKADERTHSIPVVVLTVSNQDRDIAASKRLGAAAYINKPVDFQNLSRVTPQLSLHWGLMQALPPLKHEFPRIIR